MTPEQQEIINGIKKHAQDNYNTDGWDYVVETMSDEDIFDICLENLAELQGHDLPTNIQRVLWVAKLLDDRRRDIQGTAW